MRHLRRRIPRSTVERDAAWRARRLSDDLARDLRQAREDAGISLRRLADAAGVSRSHIQAIETGARQPRLEALARVSAAMGMDLGFRLYPNSGPLIRDHIQAAMIEEMQAIIHRRWHPLPEVPVHRPVRGVIDLVLDDGGETLVACEAQSELRRLEQQLRWSRAKTDALAEARGRPASRLLLLRSTRTTRAVAAEYAATIGSAFPARTADAYAALVGEEPWPGDAIVWCRVERGQTRVLPQPPRGIAIGR